MPDGTVKELRMGVRADPCKECGLRAPAVVLGLLGSPESLLEDSSPISSAGSSAATVGLEGGFVVSSSIGLKRLG